MLTPLWGCGLEGEVLTTVRARARGDLPAAEADSVLLDGGSASLNDLPPGVEAVTVEGLFGESVVLAVGRTPRLPRDGSQPVYVSPPDQLCPVESDLAPRDRTSVAAGPRGVVLAVGGEGAEEQLLDEVVLLRDDDDAVLVTEATLPYPSRGHSLTPLGGDAFVLVGGATAGPIPLGDAVVLHADRDTMSVDIEEPVALRLDDGSPVTPRAHHGAVALPDGRVLVQGGCTHVERAACVPSEASVLRSGFYLDARGSDPTTVTAEAAPPMLHPRYDHTLLASRDGAVFAIGGHDDQDEGLRDIEMLLPGTPGWTPYGPALFEALGERDIVGATLLEGGLVVLVVEDGTLWRVDQNHVERLEGWCTGEGAPCFLPPQDDFRVRRAMVGLWGERVMVDRFVLPVGILGRTGAQAVDLSAVKPGRTFNPPGPRVGASSVVLADGTVLGIGGRVPASRSLVRPVVTRFRPLLDGPDEGTPDISAPDGGALILHDRSGSDGRIGAAAQTQTLLLEPDPTRPTDFASTWVHFRGFRSRRFVFEGAYEALNGTPSVHVVFSRGAIARTELAIDVDSVRLLAREADGSAVAVTCDDQGLNFAGVGHTVGVEVSPRAIDVRVDGEPFARCPWAGEEAVAVGLGAVGAGTLRASGLRLSRN